MEWIPNGVDFATMEAATTGAADRSRLNALSIAPGQVVFAYAGIIGHAQGLEVILHAAARLKDRRDIHFLLIGDGPERAKLMELHRTIGPVNVHFVDKMTRTELISLLRSVDGVVVPLRRNDLFKGAIPSKIFEALALEKPLLLGVEGEAKELFIGEGKAGLAFTPEDAGDLAAQAIRYADDPALRREHGSNGLRYVRTNFDRERINDGLWNAIRQLA